MDDKDHKALLLIIEFQILGAKNTKVHPSSGKGKDLIRKYVIKLE